VTIHVYDENRNEIYKKRKLKVAPGEMENIQLKAAAFEGVSELSFELEVK
jgi:hypothetical protein